MQMKGTQGTGIRECDPQSGNVVEDPTGTSEECVAIYLETKKDEVRFKGLFTAPLRIEGVLFGVEAIGALEPQ